MSPEALTQVVRHMLYTAIELASPFLAVALVVGFLISLFQAATQIQEMTLSFVPKMLLIGTLLVILFPWMLKMLTKFTNNLWIYQWEKIVYHG